MTGKWSGQKWVAPAVMAVLALVFALAPAPDGIRDGWVLAALAGMLLLPVAAAMTGALSGWPVTAALCLLGAAGWRAFPREALPLVLFWCIGHGVISCLPMKKRVLRPVLRAVICLASWGIGLLILQGVTGGQVIGGLARAACDYVDHSPDSTEILLRAYSAGYARLEGAEALVPAVRLLGNVMIPEGSRAQMLLSLRVSIEEILPTLLCGAVVYHTALTVLLSTVLPDWRKRKTGREGEFAPMEEWYMPRRLGLAVFALCIGWVMALMAQDGVGAYLGWLCMDVFRAAFMLQGICWMQWMGKRMGIRSTVRNIWSVILSVVIPLIPMIMGMIDQRRDARHLRPKEEADQE